MSCMGIDQSFTSTAVYIDGTSPIVTVIKSNKSDDVYTRAQYIANQVVTIAQTHKPTTINIEGLAFGSVGNATRDLAGLQMLIICALRTAGFDPKVIPPNTLKKASTQDGRASKEKMHECLPDNIKLSLSTYKKSSGLYDLVDAYWLSKYEG